MPDRLTDENLFIGIPTSTGAGGPTTAPGSGVLVDPKTLPAAPILLTYPDGSSIIAVFKDPTSPVPTGYFTSSNAYIAGPPPPGWLFPGQKDIDVVGRSCIFDSVSGSFLGTVITEIENSVATGTTPAYVSVFLKADGSVERPYAPIASHRQDVCGGAVVTVTPIPACLRSVSAGGDPIPGTFDIRVLDFGIAGGQAGAFLHWVFDIATGFGYPGAVSIPGPNPSPIPMSSVPAVQAQLDAAFGAGHVRYTIDPGNPDRGYIYGLTSTCVSDHIDLLWWGDFSSYILKDGLTDGVQPVPAPGGISYRSVQAVTTIVGVLTTVDVREKDGTPVVPTPLTSDWEYGACPKCIADGRPQASKTFVLVGPATYTYSPTAGSTALTMFRWDIDTIQANTQVDVTKNGDTTGYQHCGFGEIDEAECGLIPSYTIQIPADAQVRVQIREAF